MSNLIRNELITLNNSLKRINDNLAKIANSLDTANINTVNIEKKGELEKIVKALEFSNLNAK